MNVDRVGKREETLKALSHVLGRAVGEVRSTDRSPEDEIAREQESVPHQAHAPRRVAGRMEHLEPDVRQAELVPLDERAHLTYLDLGYLVTRAPGHGVGQGHAIRLVD